ncbi:MAG TPA: hypothetical protein VGZ48_13200 [Candidatus Acidoferrales bacterium]|nr:hypothetical protein [Candidatus Acidoferrales bacterium]
MRTRSRWRFIASTYCDGTAENLAWWEFGIFLIGGQIGVAGGDLVWSIVLVGKKMSANGMVRPMWARRPQLIQQRTYWTGRRLPSPCEYQELHTAKSPL